MTDKRLDIEIDVKKSGAGDTEALRGLTDVKDAAQGVKTQLADMDQPILQDVAKSAPEAADQIKAAGEAAIVAGDGFGDANPNISKFREALGGISQLSNGDVAGQLTGLGRVVDALGKSGGLPIASAQFAALAAGIAVALKGFELLSDWMNSDGQTIEEQLAALGTESKKTAEDFEDLSNIDPDFSGVVKSIQEVRDAYAEIKKEADSAWAAQERLTTAQDKLDRAQLEVDRAKAMAAAPTPEAAEAAGTLFDATLRDQSDQQTRAAKIREIQKAEEDIARETGERAAILASIAVLEKRIEEAKAKELAAGPAYSPAVGITVDPGRAAREDKQSAQSELLQVRQQEDPKLKELQDGIDSKIAELDVLRVELLALGTAAEAIKIQDQEKVKAGLESLVSLVDAQNKAVGAAQQSGDNSALVQAVKDFDLLLEWKKRFQASLAESPAVTEPQQTTVPAQLPESAPSIGPTAAASQPVAPEVVSVVGQSLEDLGAVTADAAVKSATVIDGEAATVKGALDNLGAGVTTSAAQAKTNVDEAGEKVKADLDGGAQVIIKAATDFSSGTASGVQQMTAAVSSMRTAIVEAMQDLAQEIAITRLEVRQAQANAQIALQQISNMG